MKKLLDIRLVAVVAVLAALMAVSVSTALGSPTMIVGYVWNGPIETDDLNDGEGISHASKVRYQYAYNPFVAVSDRVNYGGRKYKDKLFYYHQAWRLEKVEWKEWDGDSWNLVHEKRHGSWRATGTPGLDYHNIDRTVTMNGGALVKHQLKYVWMVHKPLTSPVYSWPLSTVHSHFLE